MKKAVIVASFGTSHEDTRIKTIDVIENDIKDNFKDYIFLRAWTSDIIRRKLLRTENIHIYDIEEAINAAIAEGVQELLVISTHIINGVEHNKVKDTVKKYSDKFKIVRIGNALLESDEDFDYIIKGFDAILKREDDKAYLFMGHGSDHPSNIVYEEFRKKLEDYKREDVYIACVEGYPYLDDVLPEILKYKKVHLLPFMIVAGEHAKNDMAGEEDSFKTVLEGQNKIVDYELKGMGEYDFVRKLILRHAMEAVDVS